MTYLGHFLGVHFQTLLDNFCGTYWGTFLDTFSSIFWTLFFMTLFWVHILRPYFGAFFTLFWDTFKVRSSFVLMASLKPAFDSRRNVSSNYCFSSLLPHLKAERVWVTGVTNGPLVTPVQPMKGATMRRASKRKASWLPGSSCPSLRWSLWYIRLVFNPICG